MRTFLEATTRSMIENSHIASVVTDAEGVIYLHNSALEALLGDAVSSWHERNLLQFLGGTDDSALQGSLGAIANGESVQEQVLFLQHQGEQLSLLLSNHPVHQDGSCAGIIWSLRELKQQSPHDVAGFARLQRYKKLFQFAAMPQLVMDVTDTYSWICAQQVFSREALQQLAAETQEVVDQLRATIKPVEYNQSAEDLFGAAECEDLAASFQNDACDTDVLQAGLVAVAIYCGEEQLEYSYEYIDGNGVPRNLLVVCALPPARHINQGVLVSFLDLTELTDAQAELRTRERFLSATLLAVPDLLFVYDYEQDCPLFVNEGLSRHLGYDWEYIEELGTQFTSTLVHPDDRMPEEHLREHLARLADGEIIEQPVRMLQANGEWRQFQSRAASLEQSGGYTRVGVIVARDITEQLEVLERVNQQEHRYKLLAENFSDVICTTDVGLNVTYLSPSVERALGYGFDELAKLGVQLLEENPAVREMRTLLNRDIAKAKRERRQPQLLELDYLRLFEMELRHKSGSPVSLEVQCSLMWDEQGDLQGLLLVCRDVTLRTRVEADRRLAAKVFENSLEGIYITDVDGRISQINRAFTELTGYCQEDVLGQRPSLLAGQSRPVSFAKVIKPILNSAGFWQGELWSRRKNGTEFPTAVGITAVAGKQGEFLGHITSFKDITERKNTEDRIHKLAYFDPLTGLPNRSLFIDRLNQELQAAPPSTVTPGNFPLSNS